MKPALAAQRTLGVLNYMALSPLRAYTLTELAGALKINLTSMTDVLLAMTEAGYLTRHEGHRTYELGPALTVVGHAAAIRHPVVELSRTAMCELAGLAGECIGTAQAGMDMLVAAQVSAPGAGVTDWYIGQRVPIIGPYGRLFTSWDSEQSLRATLGSERAAEIEAPEYAARAKLSREMGFVVALESEAVKQAHSILHELALSPLDSSLKEQSIELIRQIPLTDYAPETINRDMIYNINFIGAPIFDKFGKVVFALSVFGFGDLSGAEVLRLGDTIRSKCHKLSRDIGGIVPPRRL